MQGRKRFPGYARPHLARLRRLCLAYPEAVEVEQFGEPWFKAGKRPFVVAGVHDGVFRVAFAADRMDQDALCQSPRFEPTPYLHQHGWTTYLSGAEDSVDWPLLEALIDTAYRRVALQRMVQALDVGKRGPQSRP